MPDNPLTNLQQQRNKSTASSWDITQPHRQQVTNQLIRHQLPANPRLCILGAGNCNDLDLATLTNTFEHIELVDIDRSAVEQGVASQQQQDSPNVTIHGGLDVTGVWDQLAALPNLEEKSDVAIDELMQSSREWNGLGELGEFGTVASTCLLSQLFDGVLKTVGEQHERYLEILAAIRQRHYQLLYDMVSPGGTALLITDFVSTETAPDLPNLSGRAFSRRLEQMIMNRNFFSGLNPMRLTKLLHEADFLSGPVANPVCSAPWLWNLGSRHYAVVAIRFQKP